MQTSTMNVMEGEVFLIKSKPQTLCNKNRIDCMEWGVFYSQDSYILHRQMPVPRTNHQQQRMIYWMEKIHKISSTKNINKKK